MTTDKKSRGRFRLILFRSICILIISPMCACACLAFLGPKSESLVRWEAIEKEYRLQQFDHAEQLLMNHIAKKREKGSAERGSTTSYARLRDIYIQRGKFREALDVQNRLHEIYIESYPIVLFLDGVNLAEIYMHLGDKTNAMMWSKRALKDGDEYSRQKQDNADYPPSVINPAIGKVYMEFADYERAGHYLAENLQFYNDRPNRYTSIPRVKADNLLGALYYYTKDLERAEQFLQAALDRNSAGMATFLDDLVDSVVMLGRIYARRGDAAKANRLHEAAMKHTQGRIDKFGIGRIELSILHYWSGRLYAGQNEWEKAAKAFSDSVVLREATGTATHPNCADAIKGLADVAAARDDLTSATALAARALEILDASVLPTHPRIAPSLVSLSCIYILNDAPEQAAPLNERLETILQKPLAIWKEDFLDTVTFYSGLLRKSGKTAEADRLDQLYARQKDKR